jgi:hypothetical protein
VDAASWGEAASSSLRRISRSNSSSDGPSDPIAATVTQPIASTNATTATAIVSRPPAPDSDGGLRSRSSSPTVNAAMAAARSIDRRLSISSRLRTTVSGATARVVE